MFLLSLTRATYRSRMVWTLMMAGQLTWKKYNVLVYVLVLPSQLKQKLSLFRQHFVGKQALDEARDYFFCRSIRLRFPDSFPFISFNPGSQQQLRKQQQQQQQPSVIKKQQVRNRMKETIKLSREKKDKSHTF